MDFEFLIEDTHTNLITNKESLSERAKMEEGQELADGKGQILEETIK